MNMHSHRQAPWLSITFAVFAIDQGTKSYIDATTSLGWSQAVTSFFNLVQVLNPGAAFSGGQAGKLGELGNGNVARLQ